MEVNFIPRHFSRQNVSSRNQSFPSTSLYHHSFTEELLLLCLSSSLPLSELTPSGVIFMLLMTCLTITDASLGFSSWGKRWKPELS